MLARLREEKASLDRALVDADRDVDAVSAVLHRLFFNLGYVVCETSCLYDASVCAFSDVMCLIELTTR